LSELLIRYWPGLSGSQQATEQAAGVFMTGQYKIQFVGIVQA
jgi:hypothetical protein